MLEIWGFKNLLIASLNLKQSATRNKELIMNYIPHEFAIGGIYFPPLLIAGILGVLASALTAMLLNRYRLSRFLYNPPLVFLALSVIYTGLIGTFPHTSLTHPVNEQKSMMEMRFSYRDSKTEIPNNKFQITNKFQ